MDKKQPDGPPLFMCGAAGRSCETIVGAAHSPFLNNRRITSAELLITPVLDVANAPPVVELLLTTKKVVNNMTGTRDA